MEGKKPEEKSLYKRLLGRSFMSVLFGTFFEKKNNTASILSILLVCTLCYVVIFREKYDYMTGVLNIVFVIIGYYFGTKQSKIENDEKDE